jgi:hypothetical protein
MVDPRGHTARQTRQSRAPRLSSLRSRKWPEAVRFMITAICWCLDPVNAGFAGHIHDVAFVAHFPIAGLPLTP